MMPASTRPAFCDDESFFHGSHSIPPLPATLPAGGCTLASGLNIFGGALCLISCLAMDGGDDGSTGGIGDCPAGFAGANEAAQ